MRLHKQISVGSGQTGRKS